jgi:hypothetical protein
MEKEEDTNNMIILSNDQRNRLMNAASKMTKDERAMMTLAQSQVIADRINQVLYELHTENPPAFVTNAAPSLGGMEFTANYAMIKRRKFYDEPRKPAVKGFDYATYVRPFKKEKL